MRNSCSGLLGRSLLWCGLLGRGGLLCWGCLVLGHTARLGLAEHNGLRVNCWGLVLSVSIDICCEMQVISAYSSSLLGRRLAGLGRVGLGFGGRRFLGRCSLLGRGLLGSRSFGLWLGASSSLLGCLGSLGVRMSVSKVFPPAGVLSLGVGTFAAAGAFLVAAGDEAFGAAAPFLASLTGPEGPLGRTNSPAFSPDVKAWLKCEAKAASVVEPRLLLDWMYFLMAWRLLPVRSLS